MTTSGGIRPVAAVGAICWRGEDVLLIRRAKPPLAGHWSLPGGRIEPGETVAEATLRELAEETGVTARLTDWVTVVDRVDRDPGTGELLSHYVLIDTACVWLAGEPVAATDALEARFFPVEALAALHLWGETLRVIAASQRALMR